MSEQRAYRLQPASAAGALSGAPRLSDPALPAVALPSHLPPAAEPPPTTAPLLQSSLPSRRTPQTQMITTTTNRRPTATPRQH
jgi:hypothetical protein